MKKVPFYAAIAAFVRFCTVKLNLQMFFLDIKKCSKVTDGRLKKSGVLLKKSVLLSKYLIIFFFSVNVNSQNDFYQSSGTPENMIDKSTLRPNVGSFSSDVTAFSEDLNRGKVNVNIPLFDFEYFDYKIPVSINNNYPQKLSNNIEGKTFYLNSRVGGDWTLSIDQFKVSRQLNGNEDENPNKGYFSSFSQSKVNNISSISNSDVISGLKGNWDPSIDVFHFSTPTVSGSFLINLIDGTFRNLTDANFNVKYTRDTNSITSFTIIDDKGTQYLFGGDESSIEISQSKTGVTSLGVDSGEGKRLKYIVEFKSDGTFATYSFIGNRANLYSYNLPEMWGPLVPHSPEYIMQTITASGFNLNSGYLNGRAVYLGNSCYGIPSDIQNIVVELPGSTEDDSDLRRLKVNTAWYLREIKLINGKKIIFNYQNSWIAYKTYASNKIELNYTGVNYTYVGLNGIQKTLNSLKVYSCMPQSFSTFQFPINESYTSTINFLKSPELVQIYDEDLISTIQLRKYKGLAPYSSENNRVIRPFVVSPSYYPNAPQETISGANLDPSLIKGITYIKNKDSLEVDFVNFSKLDTLANGNRNEPYYDYSVLNELVINNSKKYIFTNIGSRLSKIKYPTGATKQFYSKEVVGSVGKFSAWGNVNLIAERVTDSIVIISENNKTTEKYTYGNLKTFQLPAYTTKKTFRPDVVTCTTTADYISTAPIYNNRVTKTGLYFYNVKKYINDDLVFMSDIENIVYGLPYEFYTTNSSNPPSGISIAGTIYEQKSLNPQKTTQYKKDSSNQFKKQSTSDFAYNFTSGSLEFPCLYLANIEAGPWSNTSGAIRRGYSRYYYPTGVESIITAKVDSVFVENNKAVNTSLFSYYKRYVHPLGTNVRKLYMTRVSDSRNTWETRYLNVNSIEDFGNMDNPLFQSMRKNNISPDLVKIVSKNNNVLGLEAYKYKLLNINSGIPVLESQKRFEANSVNINNIIGVSFNPSDPNNLIYDSRYKDVMIYDKYDLNGRLIEYYKPNGNHTSIIWGYKGQYPIAKLDNISYGSDTYGSGYTDLKNTSVNGTEGQLLTALKNLSSYLGKKTTYTYKPFGGISTVTDEKGFTTFYEYDEFNRLKQVKDKDGKILSENQYHYKN